MRFRDIRIGVRINAGYAILIVLMLVVIVLAGSRIYAIRAETDDILQRDWVAAKATSKIHGLAREAATRITSLPNQHELARREANQAHLEAIKQGIDEQVRILDGLDARPEERRLLEHTRRLLCFAQDDVRTGRARRRCCRGAGHADADFAGAGKSAAVRGPAR